MSLHYRMTGIMSRKDRFFEWQVLQENTRLILRKFEDKLPKMIHEKQFH